MAKIHLFNPVTVGGRDVKNRVWMPPMCQYSALPAPGIPRTGHWPALAGVERQGAPTQWHLQHYVARALGGVGAVIVEATGVEPDGRISSHCLSLHDDALIPAFAQVVDAIHEAGAAAYLQIVHSGRKGSRPQAWDDRGPRALDDGGWELIAPSPVPFSPAERTPRELTDEGILAVVEAFAQAARRAILAGFDGVQIHSAHGYLIHQFLSPVSNQRSDAWGGDFEGRTRFVRAVTCAVRRAVDEASAASPTRGAVLLRISATDWVNDPDAPAAEVPGPQGWCIADTQRLAPLLVEDGVDMFCVSTGGGVADAPIPAGPSYQVPAARAVKDALRLAGLSEIPVSTVGLITSAQQADQILLLGHADVVEVGRALLSDPTLPQQWRTDLRLPAETPAQYLRGLGR